MRLPNAQQSSIGVIGTFTQLLKDTSVADWTLGLGQERLELVIPYWADFQGNQMELLSCQQCVCVRRKGLYHLYVSVL